MDGIKDTNRRRRITIMALLLLPLVVWMLLLYHDGASPRVGLALGYGTVHAMANARQTKTLRLDDNDSHKVTAVGKTFGAAESRQIAKLVFEALRTAPIYFGSFKKCEPMPGVSFQLSGNDGGAEVQLCFACDILIVSAGKRSREADFDAQRPQLLRLVKAAFPNDKKLQSLTEQR